MNSSLVICNQKCNFYCGILMFKEILFSGALMLKWFFARNRLSPDFYGSQFGGFLDRRPPHSEFEGTKPPKGMCINRNTTFEPLSVQFGPKLRPVGWPRKLGKKRWEKKVTKLLYFTNMWRRHCATDLHQIWWVCGSYRHNHACQVWFQNIHWCFQAERSKNASSL